MLNMAVYKDPWGNTYRFYDEGKINRKDLACLECSNEEAACIE